MGAAVEEEEGGMLSFGVKRAAGVRLAINGGPTEQQLSSDVAGLSFYEFIEPECVAQALERAKARWKKLAALDKGAAVGVGHLSPWAKVTLTGEAAVAVRLPPGARWVAFSYPMNVGGEATMAELMDLGVSSKGGSAWLDLITNG